MGTEAGTAVIDRASKIIPEPESFDINQIQDESEIRTDGLLEPQYDVLRRADKKGEYVFSIDFQRRVIREFSYLSHTADLETEGDRVDILNQIVSRMLDGDSEGRSARVVIMKKGRDPNAFVTPDNTIFINQALLNSLDNLDEIAAVLAHEVEHIQNETAKAKANSGGLSGVGVGWLHEMVGDLILPKLLEKADFNSLAFRTAIRKISPHGRDFEHQTGLARGAQSVGMHMSIDFATSNKPITPKPEILNGPLRATNLEIISHLLKDGKNNEVIRSLPRLYPHDLLAAYARNFPNSGYLSPEKKSLLVGFNEFFLSRMYKKGYSRDEALYFITNLEKGKTYKSWYLYETPNDLKDVSLHFGKENRYSQIYEALFDSQDRKDPYMGLLEYLGGDIYDVELFQEGVGLPLTKDTFLDALVRIDPHKVALAEWGDISTATAEALLNYVDKTFLALAARQNSDTFDEASVRGFFEEVKARRIFMKTDDITSRLRYRNRPGRIITKGEPVDIKSENRTRVLEIFEEVFEIKREKSPVVNKEFIDSFFYTLDLQENDIARGDAFGHFLDICRSYFDTNKVTAAERLALLGYFADRVNELEFFDKISVFELLKDGTKAYGVGRDSIFGADDEFKRTVKEGDKSDNRNLYGFNMKVLAALRFFTTDSPEFYQFMEKVMVNSGLDLNKYSKIQLLNLNNAILSAASGDQRNVFYGENGFENASGRTFVSMKIENSQKIANLPFIRSILDLRDEIMAKDLTEFLWSLSGRTGKLFGNSGIFEDNLTSIIGHEEVREKLINLLSGGIEESEFGALFEVVGAVLPQGAQREEILKVLNVRYLRSESVSLDEKIVYLKTHFNRVGPEGMQIVAEGIDNISDYEKFSKSMGKHLVGYLEGTKFVSALALADVVSSEFTKNFGTLFSSCLGDAKSKKEVSTKYAQNWISRWMQSYHPERGKFEVDAKKREAFQSFADEVSLLRGLSESQKFAIAFKALTDRGGAFDTLENRKKMADILVKSLNLKPGFVEACLRQGCEGNQSDDGNDEQDVLVLPVANMLRSILFQSLDLDHLDYKKLGDMSISFNDPVTGDYLTKPLKKIVPRGDLRGFFRARTRELYRFGARYENSDFANWANKSDSDYGQSLSFLKAITAEEIAVKSDDHEELPDPGLEAVVHGVESTALGTRSLQTATQIQRFSPDTAKRLSSSFDANPGLEKLRFWENLKNLAEKDVRVKEFLSKLKLGQYLGGGSLYTTYAGVLVEDGQEKEVVVKVLNPNAEGLLGLSYKIAQGTFEEVGKKSKNPKDHQYARLGQVLVDMSNNWCLQDINDPRFEEDDQKFRKVIEGFNSDFGERFYAPELVLNTPKVKSEDKAQGRTLNKFLQDSRIPRSVKREIVRRVVRFYFHQLETGSRFTNENGEEVFIVHSDPHVGNIMISDETAKSDIGVIDRNMYLRLTKADVDALRPLIKGGNPLTFLEKFVGRVMDEDSVINSSERQIVGNRIRSLVMQSIGRQLLHGRVDQFSIMQEVATELTQRNMDIPLKLRLMIRNVAAFRILASRYGVNVRDFLK